jgi:hypothetical protein
MFKKSKSNFTVFVLAMTLLLTAMMSVFVGCGAEPTVIDVQMMMPPDKTEYVVDEEFDATGMVITAVYSDGTRKQITDYTIDKTGALKLEDKVVIISYGDYKFEQPITVVKPGDKIIMILANGVDRCELYADGTLQLAGGGGSLRKPNVAKWSWDGETLEIWIPLVTAGASWGEQTVDEEPTKMELEYDEQNNIQFAYMLAGRWQMHYFIQFKEWSAVLTSDVRYPI